MNIKKLTILSSLLLAGLSGCTTAPVAFQETEKRVAINNTQALLSITPEWYLSPPLSTQGAIYAVSTAVNEDLQYAINKAVLLAEQGVVKGMATEVSSLEVSELTNSGGNNDAISSEYIEARIDKAGLFGHIVNKREVFPDPKTGEFRAFIMVYLSPKAKANILTAAIKNDEQLLKNQQLTKLVADLEAKANAAAIEDANKY